MNHQQASLLLYLAFTHLSNKLGNRPCLKLEAKDKISYFASLCIPGIRQIPLSAIKVSLPQHLDHPVEKWGRPADIDSL